MGNEATTNGSIIYLRSGIYRHICWCARVIGQQLLYEILGKLIINSACNIHTDNQTAIRISQDDVNHQRTKHIDIQHHFIRDHIKIGDMKLTWVPTSQQTADILTKLLEKIQHAKLRQAIMNAQQI